MATTRNTLILRWLAITAGTLWILGAGWLQLFSADRYSYQRPSQGTTTFAEKCQGMYTKREFPKRYDCVFKLMLGYGRSAFASAGARKAFIVVLPPLLLLALYRVAVTNRNRRKAEEIARSNATRKLRLMMAKEKARKLELAEQERKNQIAREAPATRPGGRAAPVSGGEEPDRRLSARQKLGESG